MNSREAAIAKLQKLSPTSLETVNAFIDFLIAQQQRENVEVKEQSSDVLKEKWEKWFAEVDKLEVSPRHPQEDYPQHLLKKYRQQGLEL